jgi:hypothetical protein
MNKFSREMIFAAYDKTFSIEYLVIDILKEAFREFTKIQLNPSGG